MSRKALFFDIDGTLLGEFDGRIPESANEALKPVRADRYPRPSRTGSALDATVMPVTPSSFIAFLSLS